MSAEDQRAAEALREAEHVVVAALLQVPGRHAELPALPPEAFSDPQAKTLYKFVTDYRKHSGGRRVVDIPLARARLETSTRPETLALLPVLDGYDAAPVSDAEFADALATIQHGYATSVLREHSRHALEATLRGDADQARDQMRTALVEAEETAAHDEPPVDVRAEAAIEQEAGHVSLGADAPDPGFDSGFPMIRGSVSMRRGELVILGGFSGDGKSSMSKTIAYNMNRAGASVLFVALEMSRREVLTQLVAQHAATMEPRGVPYREILEGTATPEARDLYLRALRDYGRPSVGPGETTTAIAEAPFHIWAPASASMERVLERARALKKRGGLDVLVVDYLELLAPDAGGAFQDQYRLQVKRMVERLKSAARELDLLLIVNHQISRAGREASAKRDPEPHYTLGDLGESSGVERAADTVLWIYTDENLKQFKQARVGIAKARKGRTCAHGFVIMADYERAVLRDLVMSDRPVDHG